MPTSPHTCRSSAETVEQPGPESSGDQVLDRWRQRANDAADRVMDRAKDQTQQAGQALRRDARRVVWRNRRQLAPWAVPVAALALGEAGAGLAANPDVGTLLAELGTDVVAAGGASGAWFWVRNKLAGTWARWHSRVTAGLLGSAAWAGALALTGAEQPAMYAALLAGTLGVTAGWWQHHRPGYPDPPAQQADDRGQVEQTELELGEDEPVVEPEPDPLPAIIENWNAHVRARGGPLPGAEISELGPITAGEAYRVQLVPAEQTLGTAQAAHERIAGGLRISPQKLLIEADTSTEDPNDLEVRVVRHSPITGTVYFDQPRYHVDAAGNGRIELGPYADGEGAGASYALYGPNSMFGGYALGSTRSGKSRLTEEVALTALSPAAPPTVLVCLDGQEGASSQALWEHALWRGGPDQSVAIGEGLLAMMRYRERYIRWRRKHGGGGFSPSLDTPGVLVVVDECDAIFKRAGELFADLARRGGKSGFGILAASQVVDLSAFGTGGDALRSSLVSGNGIAMKTTSNVQGTVFPGLKADLTKLPPYGYGYTAGGGQQVSHRTAQFRTRFLPDRGDADRMDQAGSPLPDWVRTVEDWFADVSGEQALSEDMGRVAGDAFLNRHAEAQADDDDLEAMFGGQGDPVEVFQQSQKSGARTAATRPGAARSSPAQEQATVTPLFAGGFGDLANPSPAPSETASEPAESGNRHEQLLALFDGHGQLSTRELSGLLGISEQAVRKRLAPLLEGGRVRQTSTRGVYTRAS